MFAVVSPPVPVCVCLQVAALRAAHQADSGAGALRAQIADLTSRVQAQDKELREKEGELAELRAGILAAQSGGSVPSLGGKAHAHTHTQVLLCLLTRLCSCSCLFVAEDECVRVCCAFAWAILCLCFSRMSVYVCMCVHSPPARAVVQ